MREKENRKKNKNKKQKTKNKKNKATPGLENMNIADDTDQSRWGWKLDWSKTGTVAGEGGTATNRR